MLRSAWVDVIALGAFTALALANKLTGHEAAACCLLVVVGRLRPPASSSSSSSGDPPTFGGVATILLVVVSLALHPARFLSTIGIERHGQQEEEH